jgi:hypothetical protein
MISSVIYEERVRADHGTEEGEDEGQAVRY